MLNLKQHGGHVLPEDVPGARDLAATVGVFLAKVGVFCAFRFGHTMVRAAYDHNRNFGRVIPPAVPLETSASFARLFLFTGYGHALNPNDPTKSTPNPLAGQPTLPFNWIIEWDRLSNKADPKPTSPGKSTRAWYRPSTTWSTRASGPKSTTTPIRTIGCCAAAARSRSAQPVRRLPAEHPDRAGRRQGDGGSGTV